MIDWLSITAVTIIIGIVSNALWDWVRDTISITSSKYIDVRGDWNIESLIELADGSVCNFNERIVIKQQFRQRIRGIIFTPHPANPDEIIELNVRGEFKDKFHIVYSYEPRFSNITDVGAGTLQINPDHSTATGASVNFGVSSPTRPSIIRFNMRKSQ